MDNSVGAKKSEVLDEIEDVSQFCLVPSPDDEYQDIVLGEGVDSGLDARSKLTRRGDPVTAGRNGALL